MTRQEIVDQLARLIVRIESVHPVRVAIDGVDASGKTTLANELSPLIEGLGRPVLRASIDGFHRPRAERYRRGADSPEGYYLDSFNHEAIRALLLEPLGPGGDRQYQTAIFNFRTDKRVQDPPCDAPANAVLLFDGVFLLRPELNDCWDFSIFIDVAVDEVVRRACERDLALFGSVDAILERYWKRYVPGQRIYLETVRPQELADAVLENTDPAHPKLSVRRRHQS
ncbi:MAG: uridine kinase [Actinobacteria bacterium]|nr:uridine kinase [Actinomycetota bacterium]MCL5027182.1 uridine kinase [Chloroflexota bacterium]